MSNSWFHQLFGLFRRRPLREDREEFRRILDRDFTPVLTGLGFTGKRPNWRRIREPYIDCVNLQNSKYHNECCVNLGVHLDFVPSNSTTEILPPKRLTVVDCFFVDRLVPGKTWPCVWDLWWGHDHWWSYRKPEKSAQKLIECFAKDATGYFDRFLEFPGPFLEPTISDAERLPKQFPPIRLFVLAHVLMHLNNPVLAKQFATLGHQRMGNNNSPFATALNQLSL